MKKRNFVLAAGLSLFISCTNKQSLPEKPEDKQEVRDSQGNHWLYNAMLMRWALTPSGAAAPTYYYYPANNSWTAPNGSKVSAPAQVNSSFYSRTPSVKPNSTSGKSYHKSTSKPSSGKAFKGAGGTSRSFGA